MIISLWPKFPGKLLSTDGDSLKDTKGIKSIPKFTSDSAALPPIVTTVEVGTLIFGVE